jgi:hypothetical protein
MTRQDYLTDGITMPAFEPPGLPLEPPQDGLLLQEVLQQPPATCVFTSAFRSTFCIFYSPNERNINVKHLKIKNHKVC